MARTDGRTVPRLVECNRLVACMASYVRPPSPHAHPCWEMLLIEQGSYRIDFGEAAPMWTAGPGQVVVVPPGQVHHSSVSLDNSTVLYVLQWSGSAPVDRVTAVEDTQGRLQLLCRWLQDLTRPEDEAYRRHLLGAVLEELRRLATPADEAVDALERLRRYIQDKHPHPIDAEHLAARLDLSVRHLDRLFRARFGYTPVQYLRQVRLDHALALLADPTASQADVARVTGFAGPAHLGRVLRQMGRSRRVR